MFRSDGSHRTWSWTPWARHRAPMARMMEVRGCTDDLPFIAAQHTVIESPSTRIRFPWAPEQRSKCRTPIRRALASSSGIDPPSFHFLEQTRVHSPCVMAAGTSCQAERSRGQSSKRLFMGAGARTARDCKPSSPARPAPRRGRAASSLMLNRSRSHKRPHSATAWQGRRAATTPAPQGEASTMQISGFQVARKFCQRRGQIDSQCRSSRTTDGQSFV